MLKEASYQDKFKMLDSWLSIIIDPIKKDLKQDHLQKDIQFCKTHFPGKSLNKLTLEELIVPYRDLLQNTSEDAGEFVTNRWLLKNSEIYYFFEERLKAITPEFNELKELDLEKSQSLMEDAVQNFGAPKTYIFSVLNSVVFPKQVLDDLAKRAEQQRHDAKKQEEEKIELRNLEQVKRNHELEIARIIDKYEKKLGGLQKKYVQDTESLKKQIAALQRKNCS